MLRDARFEAVHAGGRLDEVALRIIAHINGEAGPHAVVRGAAAAFEVPRLEGELGDIRIVQRVADLFEYEARGGLEIQGVCL
jgi:hypothetical protein